MREHDKQGEVLDHEYDGIQELDNPLPSWWLATFYGAIIFSVLYVSYYLFGPGLTLEQELAADMGRLKTIEEANRKNRPALTEEQLAAAFADQKNHELGGQIFAAKCAACHGNTGEGQIGPNLTDNFWIHGDSRPVSLIKIISEGVPEKGMPPWASLLAPEEVVAVASHVKSIIGTHPKNPKAAQGTEIKE